MNYKVNLIRQKKRVTVSGGTVAEACAKAGYPLQLTCGGQGICRKCMVTIVSGSQRIKVLACRTPVRQNMDILVEEEQLIRLEAVQQPEDRKQSDLSFHPAIHKEFDPSTSLKLYGAAVDIGTTSVVVYLYDMLSGQRLAVESALNAQAVHGADVISRIAYAAKEEHLKELQGEIAGTINQLLRSCVDALPELSEEDLKQNLRHIVLCGNSVMQHLFFGWQPEALGRSPYVNVTTDYVRIKGEESGLLCAQDALIEFLPLIESFVGADTLACLLAMPEELKDKTVLMMDLGTNGELALCKEGRYYVASTACGPALEGGNISCGTVATEGAIDKVVQKEKGFYCHVIGEMQETMHCLDETFLKGRGLCGSAILDLTALYRRENVLTEDGRLDEKEAIPSCLNQADIRQIQLAKAAIATGVEVLLAEQGMTVSDLDVLVLAGAFGNYINIEYAMELGLLPKLPKEGCISLGNAAGLGAQMVLLDDRNYEKIRQIKENTLHVELAGNPLFSERFPWNTSLKS